MRSAHVVIGIALAKIYNVRLAVLVNYENLKRAGSGIDLILIVRILVVVRSNDKSADWNMWASSLYELAGRWGPKLVIASGVVAVLQLAACAPNNASSFATVSSIAKSAASGPSLDSRAPEYRLGTGDKVRLTIYNETDLSGEFELDGSGSISLALLGKVKAGGLTVPEFEKTLQEKLRTYLKNPRVSVEVANYRPFYIHGEVRSSGEYQYSNGLTVKNAIVRAGGYSYRAVKRYVLIRRANESDAKKYSLSDNVRILPGDNIFVPERIF